MGSARLGGELPLLAFTVIALAIAWRGRRSGAPMVSTLLLIGTCAWATALVALTLFPLPLPPYDAVGGVRASPWIEPVPLRTIGRAIVAGWSSPEARTLVGNVAAFVPLGILAPTLSGRARSWARIALLGLAVSLAVETSQLALSLAMGFPWRVFDVDDLLLNTLGAVLGYALWRLGFAILRRGRPRDRTAQPA